MKHSIPLVLTALCAVSPLHAEGIAGKRPNIIFILTDDQGYGDSACHGNPVLKTPNLDRLHDEGVRFTDFHVSPTCSPTRAPCITGRHEFRNGVTHTILERERLTLDAITLAASAPERRLHHGHLRQMAPRRRDAHTSPTGAASTRCSSTAPAASARPTPAVCGDAPGNTYFNPAILHNGKFEKTEGYCTDVFFAQAVKWIDSVKGKQPFYAYIAPNAPHAPLQVRDEEYARYTGKVNDPTRRSSSA